MEMRMGQSKDFITFWPRQWWRRVIDGSVSNTAIITSDFIK